DPVRIGEIFQGIRRFTFDQLHITGGKLLQVLADKGDAVGIMLYGKELAVRHEIARLDRYRTASGTDVPDSEVILELELGQGYRPHLLLRYQFLDSSKFVVVDADQWIVDQIRLPGLDQYQDVQFRGRQVNKALHIGFGEFLLWQSHILAE